MSLTKFNARIGDNLLEVVSSIEELKSLKHFNHPVLVLGAVDIEDGDGGIYFWDGSNNEENDDISRIRSNGNGVGRWKRLSYALNSSVDAPLNFEAESSRTVSFQQGNHSFGVASRFNVRATSNVDWITIGNIDRDDLSHTLNYSVSQNLNSSSREGVITIKNGFNTFTYVVTQDEVESISGRAQLVYTNQARSNNIAMITSNASWSASASDNWITLTSSNGNGNGSIQFDLTENSSQFADRTGTITITTTSGYVSHVITIAQSQAASIINDVVDQNISSDASNNQSFIVNSDIGWTATTNTDWITITTGTGDNGDSVVYSVTQNTDADNDRTGTITLTSDNNTNVVTVNIIQGKLADAFSLRIDTTLVSDSNQFVITRARNITVDWGDSSPSQSTSDNITFQTLTHTYATDGQYIVSITQNDRNNPATTIDVRNMPVNSRASNWYLNSGKINGSIFQSSEGSCDFSFNFVASEQAAAQTSQKMIIEILSWGDLKIDSLQQFMPYATNLANIASDVDQFDTSSVVSMANAFYYCEDMTSFPLINTSNVTDMGSAWGLCKSLTSFPSIDTSSVTDMTRAWYYCDSLTSFPLINTSNVTDMLSAWNQCRSLISFPPIDTSSVTNMGHAWYHCDSLTSFPSIDVSANRDFTRTWYNCTNLSTFDPFTNTTYISAQWDETWGSCDNLTFTSVSDSPFTNIGSNTLPVSINVKTLVYRSPGESTYQNLGLYDPLPDDSTYYPPFDVSDVNAIYIDDSGTTITDFNIIGWDQMTFARVNYGADPNPTVEIDINATLANTKVDNILNQLYSNLSNHTQLEGTSTYSINFHSNVRTTASDTAYYGLLAAGWNITLNNVLQLGTGIQLGSDIDGEANRDWSGYSVSLNAAGDRVAIGAINNDGNGGGAGHTRIYEYSGTNWTQLGSDIDGEAAGDLSGYSVSLNAAGDRVAIGAINNDDNGHNSGHTRIYQYSNDDWSQLGSDIVGEAIGDLSGSSVSLNAAGDRVAIGANENAGNNPQLVEQGHVRIYEYSNETWTQLGSDIDGEASYDKADIVDLNAAGSRVAVASSGFDGDAYNIGHVRIYEYSNETWTQLGSDIEGKANSDGIGRSLSFNAVGNRIIIGGAGHTRIYEYSNGTWTQLGQDIDDEAIGDESGWSVSMNDAGDKVAIGAPDNDGNGDNSGHTRIYQYSNGTWSQLGSDIDGEAADDHSGYSVSLNAAGDRVAIGAINNDGNGFNSGHTRIYQI